MKRIVTFWTVLWRRNEVLEICIHNYWGNEHCGFLP